MRGGVGSCVNACIRFIEKGGIFGEMETQKENFVRSCRSLFLENRPLTTDFLPLAKASI